MPNIKVKLNQPGIRAFLNSEGVQSLLQEQGDAIAARAESFTKTRAVNQRNPDYVVAVVPGRKRATCFVWASNVNSLLAEVHDRALTRAAGQ